MKKLIIVFLIILLILILIVTLLQRFLTGQNTPRSEFSPSPTTFHTGSSSIESEVNTAPPNAAPTQEAYDRVNSPDLFLSNKTPYSTGEFSVTYTYVRQPTGHFAFTVVLNGDQARARQAFQLWALSLGLTQAQIDRLDITYR